MLPAAAGVVVAIVLFWIAAQFFGGRFSRFPHSESQGCILIVIAMVLLLAAYVFGIAP